MVNLLIQTAVPLAVATVLFSGYTLLRVITYTANTGTLSPDPGFAPAGNSLFVFIGMEVTILLVALSWVVPFFFIAVALTLLALVTLQSKLLHIVLSTAVGSLLAAGWLYDVCHGFEAIAQTLIPFFAIGFLLSSFWATSMRTMR